MTTELNKVLREKINETDFILAKYQNHNSKDQWSCICSAMDWIDVGMTNINKCLEELNNSEGLETCMKFYQYICCIDMVWESICQLHRVFIDNKTIPFKGDSKIFKRKVFNVDDNNYFKEIRACFGAHSVNLNPNEKFGLKFASWSTHFGSPQTMSILLYSNIPGDSFVQLEVTVESLKEFYNVRCEYLQDILNAIDNVVYEFKQKMIDRKIPKSNDPKVQIEILKNESEERFGGNVLIDELEQIEHFLSTKFYCQKNKENIEEFGIKVIEGINEIYNCLQNMCVDFELNIEKILIPKLKPNSNDFTYNFSQMCSKVIANIRKSYDAKSIKQPLQKYIHFEYKTEEELYWLTVIALNIAQKDLEEERKQNDSTSVFDIIKMVGEIFNEQL